jgi:hypothetical protein
MSTDHDDSLGDLFVEVTGEEAVQEQQTEAPSHEVMEESGTETDRSSADGTADGSGQ